MTSFLFLISVVVVVVNIAFLCIIQVYKLLKFKKLEPEMCYFLRDERVSYDTHGYKKRWQFASLDLNEILKSCDIL